MLYQRELAEGGNYDLIVCGGGFSGFAAAYAAAREGQRVLLVERGGCLGGVGTAGLVNDILGQRRHENGQLCQSVGGIFDQLERRLLAGGHAVDTKTVDPEHNPHGWLAGLASGFLFDNEYMKAFLEDMLDEVGVELLYHTDVLDVVRTGNWIEGVVIYNKSGLQLLRAIAFVDATGDGDVCRMACVPFDKGDEEGGLAAASLEMHVEGVDREELERYMYETKDFRFRAIIARLREQGVWNFPCEIFISVKLCRDDVFFINTIRQVGIDGTDARSLTAGTVEGRRENLALLDIMRAHFPGFAQARLRQIAPMIGIRETRRIRGDYVLTTTDLIEGTVFPDTIAVSSYGWDLPHPKHPSLQPYAGIKRRSPYTHIPYRCLLPIGIENLIAVGRCISCEREVLGPVRVMGPCLAMGEAAGIAAALAKDGAFRSVNTDALRARIQAHGGIVDMD